MADSNAPQPSRPATAEVLGSPPSATRGNEAARIDSKVRNRSSSRSGFWTKLLPSHKPERGGTLRGHGYWEAEASGESALPLQLEQHPRGRHKRRGSDIAASSIADPGPVALRRTQTVQESEHQRPKIAPRQQLASTTKRDETFMSEEQPGKLNSPAKVGVPASRTSHLKVATVSSQAVAGPSSRVVSQTKILFDAKREARRLRRSLKESSDFLGVQGINPGTGELDILTPTDSSHNSDVEGRSSRELQELGKLAEEARNAYEAAKTSRDAAREGKEKERLGKILKQKESIRALQRRVKWRKDKNNWSSLAEPDLSPIPSLRSGGSDAHGVSPPGKADAVPLESPQRSPSTFPETSPSFPRPKMESPLIDYAQESSDTVIHNIVGSPDIKSPSATELFKNGISIGSSSNAPQEPSQADAKAGRPPPVDRAVRRKPVASPLDIKQSADKHFKPEQGSPAFSTVLQNESSFLGEVAMLSGSQDESSVTVTSSLTTEVDLTGQKRLTTPPPIGLLPNFSPETPVVMRKEPMVHRKGRVPDRTTSLASPDRLLSNTTNNSRIAATTKPSCLPKTRETETASQGPIIPRRLGPSRADTSPVKDKTSVRISHHHQDKLIDIATPPPPNRGPIRSRTDDLDQSRDWANLLIQDIDLLGRENISKTEKDTKSTNLSDISNQDRKETGESACTPTTTTITGSARDLPSVRRQGHLNLLAPPAHIIDEINRVTSGSGARATRTSRSSTDASSTTLVNARLSPSSMQPSRTDFDLLASPPRLQQRDWPSLPVRRPGEAAAALPLPPLRLAAPIQARMVTPLPASATTSSARQLSPTKVRVGLVCRRVSSGTGAEAEGRSGKENETEGARKTPTARATSTSISPAHYASSSKAAQPPSTNSPPKGINATVAAPKANDKHQKDKDGGDLMAQEAAKLATAQHHQGARIVTLPPPHRRLPRPPRPGAAVATGARSGKDSRPAPRAFALAPRAAAALVVRFVIAYWDVVSPVFDAGSPMRRRFAERKSTWRDAATYALALGFVAGALLIGVWCARGLAAVVRLVRVVVRGFVAALGV